jgi:hypothetical protein
MAVQHSIHQGVLTMEFVGISEPRDVVRRFLAALSDPACPTPVALLIRRVAVGIARDPLGCGNSHGRGVPRALR